MGWKDVFSLNGYAYFIIGIALILKSIQESWSISFNQYDKLLSNGKVRKLSRLKYGFWSLLFTHLERNWMYWLPGILFILLWCWNHYGLYHEINDDIIDDSDVPELEPISDDLNKKNKIKTYQALLQHKARYEPIQIVKPNGWLVYDPIQGKLIVAATGKPA